MRVSPITSISTRGNNNYLVNNQYKKANSYSISFCRNFSEEELDLFLENFKELRKIAEETRIEKEKARNETDKKLEKINKQIEPLIKDSDFLWQITPIDDRRKYAAFVTGYREGCSFSLEESEELFNRVILKIKESFLSNKSESILNIHSKLDDVDLSNIPFELQEKLPEYEKSLQQLKNLVKTKFEIDNQYKKQVEEIDMKMYEKSSGISILPNIWDDVQDLKTFESKLVDRAINKIDPATGEKEYPELPEMYNELKTKYYNKYFKERPHAKTPDFNSHTLAVSGILAYLKTGIADADALPF